ncbi:MAG TPA: hypothetical protein VNO75_09910 [Gemmatimonadaceae bacterium]|nr:hypothetical protein [Gemmatimonadaceae bacterium]
MAWLPIRYREFYDVPREFVVERDGEAYYFTCPFNDQADDYAAIYQVYRLHAGAAVGHAASWAGLERLGSPVGQVNVAHVTFDATKRAAVEGSVLEGL